MILALIVYLLAGEIFVLLLLDASEFNRELPIRHPRWPKVISIVACMAFWPVLLAMVIWSWRRKG
jgi:hypothetical protein